MKLYYMDMRSKLPSKSSNFGDELNKFIWDKVAPGIFDKDESSIFVGIGTLINNYVPISPTKIVFSSGAGYGNVPKIDKKWYFYCVRGPLTAKVLGIDERISVCDGAYFLRKIFRPEKFRKEYRFSFMPHVEQAEFFGKDLKEACELLRFGYIDPRWHIDKVLRRIAKTEVLLAEAIHGDIVSDSIRVPWIPVILNPGFNYFKWEDWCSSIKVDFRPEFVLGASRFKITRAARTYFKHSLKWLANYSKYFPRVLSQDKIRFLSKQLSLIARKARPLLSDEGLLDHLGSELEKRMDKFKSDHSSGMFCR